VDFKQIVKEFSQRLLASVERSRDDLKTILASACEAVGSAEASILVLNESGTHLRFLASLNETLDEGDVEIERDKTFSGFVFDSGQMIAKVKPASEGAGAIHKKAGVRTDYLLVVPVMSEERVIAVGTFVNRAEGKPDEGFMKREFDVAQQFAELYATALKAHCLAVFAYQTACRQLIQFAAAAGVDVSDLDELRRQHICTSNPGESILTIDQKLSASERTLWRQFGKFLLQEKKEDGLFEDET